MILWRISNHNDLEGRGGLLAPGRWHSLGRRIVYTAETPAGALAEALVHLEIDLAGLPKSYGLLKIEAPDDIAIHMVAVRELGRDWTTNEIATRTMGDEWLAANSSALLRVPSAIVPETFNVLVNPQHSDARRLKILWHEFYPWDSRLLQ
jgi:RES domain-containing protein